MSVHINFVFLSIFFWVLLYAVFISSLFYDHAADEAAIGSHSGGNAKQGALSLLSEP